MRRVELPPEVRAEIQRERFFDTANQYYASARYAFHAAMSPVSGNLFHHAIEMYLKGAMVDVLDQQAMRKVSHDIEKLWSHYKQSRKGMALSDLDNAVAMLDKYEELRYPLEEANVQAMYLWHFETDSPLPQREYGLVLEDMDLLVKRIFEIEQMNPQFYAIRFNEHTLKYLGLNNRHNAFETPVR